MCICTYCVYFRYVCVLLGFVGMGTNLEPTLPLTLVYLFPPPRIEGDKVSNFTIRQSFNHDERWTKALKYVLCNLKWALVWLNNNNLTPAAHPPTAAPSPTSRLSSASSSVNAAQQSGSKDFWLF